MTNPRILEGATPEDRIAAAARLIMVRMIGHRDVPDYADFRDLLRPYVEREILMGQLEEAKASSTFRRVLELQAKLDSVMMYIESHPI
jgi:hypothetical protein